MTRVTARVVACVTLLVLVVWLTLLAWDVWRATHAPWPSFPPPRPHGAR